MSIGLRKGDQDERFKRSGIPRGPNGDRPRHTLDMQQISDDILRASHVVMEV